MDDIVEGLRDLVIERLEAENTRLREVIKEAHQHWVDGDDYKCFQVLNEAENRRYEKAALKGEDHDSNIQNALAALKGEDNG